MKRMKKIECMIISLCIGVIITFAFSVYAEATEKSISAGIIRLHVIANSDTDADQNLKLRVRDRVIEKAGSLFVGHKDKNSAIAKLTEHKEQIAQIAKSVVEEYGYDYEISVTVGRSDFPTKTYGNATFPAGTYDALKIVIGEGEGKNWWCVLFPPLCFVDATTATLTEESDQMLKSSLTDEQYDMITGEGGLPVQVKFKTYELWQESKIKFKNMLASLN